MVNFIKSFGKVNSTDVYGATWIKTINNFTTCIYMYSIGTSQAFLKTNWLSPVVNNDWYLSRKHAVFKQFTQNGGDCNPPKVVTSHGFGASVFQFGERYYI